MSIYMSGDLTTIKGEVSCQLVYPMRPQWRVEASLRASHEHIHLNDFLGRNLRRQMPKEAAPSQAGADRSQEDFSHQPGERDDLFGDIAKKSICVLKIFRLHDFL